MKRAPNPSRRAVLKAGGVVFALPFLPSVAWAEPAPPSKRFVGMYMANGVYTPSWFPTVRSPTDFTLNTSHAPLAALKEHVLFLSGLNSAVAVQGEGEQHQRGLGAMLTGAKLAAGNFIGNDGTRAGWAKGASLDQVLVGVLGQGTRVPSLQLGVYSRERDVSGALSYAGDSQPLLPENDPQQTFRTLFMDSGTPAPMLEGIQLKRASILDSVLSQFNAVKRRVASSERMRLDAHATKVRELEIRLTTLPGTPPTRCRIPTAPAAMNYASEAAMPEAARLHLDLLTVAFACDTTRLGTVMFSDAKNHIAMPFCGVTSGVHNVSHYGDGDPQRAALANRDRWVVEQLAYFITALRDTQDSVGSLLDHTLIFLGSDVARGNLHNHEDMPFLVAGHGAGWPMGRALRFSGQPHNNLLLAMLRALGGDANSFGDPSFCTGPLTMA